MQTAGLPLGVLPEEWVFDEPQKILALHCAFFDAGSDVILTSSCGGTRLRMSDSKYADRVPELNHRAAALARQAESTRDGVLVAASMGLTGGLMVF